MPYTIPSQFTQWLTLDDVPTRTTGWQTITHRPLLAPPQQIGFDRPLPGGLVINNPRAETVTIRDLPMEFFGEFDWDGNLAADPSEQVELNFLHFTEAVCSPPGGDGTRDAVLHLPGARPNRAGPVHVSGSQEPVSVTASHMRWTLTLSLPAGRLVEVEA